MDLTNLSAVLVALGEHLPGIVVAIAMVYLYKNREKEIAKAAELREAADKVDREECRKCKEDHAVDTRQLLDRTLAAIERVSDGLDMLNSTVAASSRNLKVGDRLDELAAQLRRQEAKLGKGRSGTTGS